MPNINIQNIGSAASATATGKVMHHPTLSAFATWLKARDLVANNEIVIGQSYDSETITGNVSFYPLTFNSSCYAVVEPAPGYGFKDLAPTGALGYGTVGVELTRIIQGNAFSVSHGVIMRGFRLHFTSNGGTGSGIQVFRYASGVTNGIFDATLTRCLIKFEGDVAGTYGVNTNVNASSCNITDNVFFHVGTAGYPLLARQGVYNRNTFVHTGTAAGLSAVSVSVNLAGTLIDNVFVQCGPKPIMRDTAQPATCVGNYTSEPVTGTSTGFTVGSVDMITSLTDVRPKAGGVLIGKGSTSSQNTSDVRGGFRGTSPDVGAVMLQAVALPAAPTGVITSIEIYGQRVTVKGTYTSSVETTSATLIPAAVPNGAVQITGSVTYASGTFTAVFTNVMPGSYQTPVIALNNQGGSSNATGGQATVVPMPAVPTIKNLSQTNGSQAVLLTGTIVGIPTSASVTIEAAATPNGAVARGPVNIPLTDTGEFSINLSALTPGNYKAPVVSVTNAGGTSTATGEIPPRIYANGTQPVGLEPAVILAPYSAPAFNTPAVALNAVVTDVTLVNTSAVAKTNVPFTFGQPFKKGDISPGSFLVGRTGGKPDVPLQFNVKTTHADGSVRFAIISGVLPDMAASQSRVMSLVRVSSSTATTVALAPSSVTTAGMDVSASIVVAGVTYTASPNSLLAAGTPWQTWFGGSVATDWIVAVPFKNSSNVSHATMTAQFSVRYYPGAAAAKIDVAFEDVHPFNSTTAITYDAAIKVNGVVKYSKAALVGVPAGRFKKTVWWGGEPSLHIKHNQSYFTATKQVPNYDLSVVMDEGVMGEWATTLGTSSFDPYNYGTFTQAMGATGGRSDIGPLPHFAAGALISMDKRAKDMLLAHADICGGAWATHRRDHTTGPGGGRPISVMYFPWATRAGTTSDSKNQATGQYEKFPSPGYGEDTSHQPSIAYLPYMLTGDFYYLEELHFWANFNIYAMNPGYRDTYKGLLHREQLRGIGWCLRTLAQAAAATPDDHPDKQMFAYWIKNNINYFNGRYTDNPDANTLGIVSEGYAILYPASGANPSIGVAPWQDDYFVVGVAHCWELLEIPDALRLLHWKAKFQVGRMLDPGYCYLRSSIYTLNVRATASSPLYTSLGECLANSIDPVEYGMRCNSQERLDYMNANRALPSNPYVLNEIIGYANSTTGYPSIHQTSLAFISDTGYPDADLAWDLMDSRAVKPNYGTSPQFAVVSRNIESAAASSITLDGPTGGMVGQASTSFTVGTNASRTNAVLVTPTSDDGGTFAPASFTLPPGSSYATFTYTPATSGVKSINVLNDGGLTQPASINYEAVSLADVTPPQMAGSLSVGQVTVSGFTLDWLPATDDKAVVGYEYSLNDGAYVPVGNVYQCNVTGLSTGTVYNILVRAFDAYGNKAQVPLSATATTLTVRTVTVRLYRNGTLLTNAAGLKWAWHDQATPDQYGAPTDKGANGTTDALGWFKVSLPNSTLTAGGTGSLEVSNSDGDADKVHQAFCGPAKVA